MENINNLQRGNITEEELEGIYMYLSMYYEQMTMEQKVIWNDIMKKLDPEFNNIEDD